MSDCYDTQYGIHDHSLGSSARPLASVAISEQESLGGDPFLKDRVRKYLRNDIKELYGLNIDQWFQRSREFQDVLVEVAKEEADAKAALLEQLKQENARKNN